jgi:hypothetical protein
MNILEFNFLKKYEVIYKLFLILLILIILSNKSYSDIFKVENTILKTDYSKEKYSRNEAIIEAINSSFDTFAKRVLVEDEYWKIKNIDFNNINESIVKFNILVEEKNKKNFIFKTSITFHKKKIQNLLNSRNIIYTDTVSSPVLVIPILKYNNTIKLWEDNFFLSNWNLDEDKTKLVKYLIPSGDLEDQKNIDLNSFDINYYDSSYFLKKYGLKNSLILFINLDKDLDNIQYKLTLNKTNYYKVFSHTISDLQLSKLINTIKIETEKIWKKKNTIFSSLVTSLEFTTNIQNIRQLNIIRSKLQKLNNIKQIKDIEVSSKAYRGKIYYSGTINDLNKNLEEINFILKENFNSWRLLTNE